MNGRLELRIITQPYSAVYWGYFRSLVFGNSWTKHIKLGSLSYSVVIFPSRFPTYRLVIILNLHISHVWLGTVYMVMNGSHRHETNFWSYYGHKGGAISSIASKEATMNSGVAIMRIWSGAAIINMRSCGAIMNIRICGAIINPKRSPSGEYSSGAIMNIMSGGAIRSMISGGNNTIDSNIIQIHAHVTYC